MIFAAIVIVFLLLSATAAGFVFAPWISDWIDEITWTVVNRREYRRITTANPHLRPETLERMTRRAWEEYRRAS